MKHLAHDAGNAGKRTPARGIISHGWNVPVTGVCASCGTVSCFYLDGFPLIALLASIKPSLPARIDNLFNKPTRYGFFEQFPGWSRISRYNQITLPSASPESFTGHTACHAARTSAQLANQSFENRRAFIVRFLCRFVLHWFLQAQGRSAGEKPPFITFSGYDSAI